MFLFLIKWLWLLNPHLQYVFTAVLFIMAGKKIRMIILLYCTISTYDMITSLCMKLGFYLHAELRSFPYLGSYLVEFVNNRTQPVGKTGGDTFPHSFTPPVSLRLVLTAFENFEYPWDAQASTLLLLCLLNGLQVLFRVCLGLSKSLRTLHVKSCRDLPLGRIAVSGWVCGTAWAGV